MNKRVMVRNRAGAADLLRSRRGATSVGPGRREIQRRCGLGSPSGRDDLERQHAWITTDGRGQVMVLVRTAPYFRLLARDGTFVKAFGDDGLFQSAHSVTIDGQGALWVTDSAAHVVHKFSADGRLLLTLGKKGVAGDNASRDLFNQPNHVALAPTGDIYVSDGYQNARVVQFASGTIRPHHRRHQGHTARTAATAARRRA